MWPQKEEEEERKMVEEKESDDICAVCGVRCEVHPFLFSSSFFCRLISRRNNLCLFSSSVLSLSPLLPGIP